MRFLILIFILYSCGKMPDKTLSEHALVESDVSGDSTYEAESKKEDEHDLKEVQNKISEIRSSVDAAKNEKEFFIEANRIIEEKAGLLDQQITANNDLTKSQLDEFNQNTEKMLSRIQQLENDNKALEQQNTEHEESMDRLSYKLSVSECTLRGTEFQWNEISRICEQVAQLKVSGVRAKDLLGVVTAEDAPIFEFQCEYGFLTELELNVLNGKVLGIHGICSLGLAKRVPDSPAVLGTSRMECQGSRLDEFEVTIDKTELTRISFRCENSDSFGKNFGTLSQTPGDQVIRQSCDEKEKAVGMRYVVSAGQGSLRSISWICGTY